MTFFQKIAERFRMIVWFYKTCHKGNAYFSFMPNAAAQWHGTPSDYFSEKRISLLKQGLDSHSCREIDIYLKNLQLSIPLLDYDYLLSADDQIESIPLREDFEKNVLKKYKKCGLDKLLPESLYFHHGLRSAPQSVKQYVVDKIFIDGGAFCGDSTLAFQQYNPKKVIAFDMSERMAKKFKAVMKKNHVPEDKVVFVLKGLGEKECEISFSDETNGSTTLMSEGTSKATIIPLDSCKEIDGPVGLIKLDVEGFGFQALNGMIETIKRDRPVLAVAVYHNADEFFGIKPLLESLDLNYKIEFKCCNFNYFGEMTLFAYPKELS